MSQDGGRVDHSAGGPRTTLTLIDVDILYQQQMGWIIQVPRRMSSQTPPVVNLVYSGGMSVPHGYMYGPEFTVNDTNATHSRHV